MGDARSGAALLVAALLAAPALAPAPPGAPPCASPAEARARDGRTTALRCDGDGPAPRGPARLLVGLGLDPNTADAASLEALPGIGPARARAIEAARCLQRFAAPGDLERVRGIGPRRRAAIAPWLAIDPAAEPACPVP